MVANEETLSLYPFQERGANYIQEWKRLIVADEPGLGKTAQAIVGLRGQYPQLVVCPSSLKLFWAQEYLRWSDVPAERIAFLWSQDKAVPEGYDVYITHWDILRLTWQGLMRVKWAAIVADEAHRAKNRKALRTRALKKLDAPYKVLLTGTPIVNRPDEIWSLLHFLFPQQYRSYWRFVEEFCSVVINRWGGYEIVGIRDREKMHRELRGKVIRRTKKTVLPELPDKRYMTIPIELYPEQIRAYTEMRDQMIARINDDTILYAPVVLSQLMRLRQIAIGLGFFDSTNRCSSKIDAVVDFVMDRLPRKTVVCTQFVWVANQIKEALAAHKVSVGVLTGQTPMAERNVIVEDFQKNDKYSVISMTAETGGTGFTLTAADALVFTDRPWTPAVVQQAEDRIHRIGQKDAVLIVTLLAHGTVEEKVERALRRKERMFNEMFTGKTFKELL